MPTTSSPNLRRSPQPDENLRFRTTAIKFLVDNSVRLLTLPAICPPHKLHALDGELITRRQSAQQRLASADDVSCMQACWMRCTTRPRHQSQP